MLSESTLDISSCCACNEIVFNNPSGGAACALLFRLWAPLAPPRSSIQNKIYKKDNITLPSQRNQFTMQSFT